MEEIARFTPVRSMHPPKRFDRKQFLSWTLCSSSALALGCSAEAADEPATGGTGGAAGNAGSAGSAGAGGSPFGGNGGSGNAGAGGTFSPGGSTSGSAGAAGGGAGGTAGGGGTAGTAGSGVVEPVVPDCSTKLKVFISGNHDHVLNVTVADVLAGVPKSYDTKGGSNHPHWVRLTAGDFAKLQGGITVRKLSCNDEHEHEFIINCIGDDKPDTSSGIRDSCDPEFKCGDFEPNPCVGFG